MRAAGLPDRTTALNCSARKVVAPSYSASSRATAAAGSVKATGAEICGVKMGRLVSSIIGQSLNMSGI